MRVVKHFRSGFGQFNIIFLESAASNERESSSVFFFHVVRKALTRSKPPTIIQ
jgi:hypothetical protein